MIKQNRIWNRNFSDWLILTIGIANLLLLLIFYLIGYFSIALYLNAFAAGLCIECWLLNGIINRLFDIIDTLKKLERRQRKI